MAVYGIRTKENEGYFCLRLLGNIYRYVSRETLGSNIKVFTEDNNVKD